VSSFSISVKWSLSMYIFVVETGTMLVLTIERSIRKE
jgi:hypothetical protein